MISGRLFHFGFLVPLIAFGIHQVLQYGLEIEIAFLDAYLDPFCASVIACYIINIERWFYFGERRLYSIDLIVLTIFLSVVSELLFPLLSDRFVMDWVDVIALALGTIWFALVARKD
jgi:hypothetical protein